MRFLLREVARRLSPIPRILQRRHPRRQRLRARLQRLNPPVRSPLRAGEKPPDPRRHNSERGADQFSWEGREVELMHEASMRGRQGDDTHANGAYIIGMTRFPPPPAGIFATTVLFGHTSTVAPSDVPSVFNSG